MENVCIDKNVKVSVIYITYHALPWNWNNEYGRQSSMLRISSFENKMYLIT